MGAPLTEDAKYSSRTEQLLLSFLHFLNQLMAARAPALEGYFLKFLAKMAELAGKNLSHVLPLKMLVANFHFYKKSYDIAAKHLDAVVQVAQGNGR